MADERPNRTNRDYAYNSPEHETTYFRGLMDKTLTQSRMSASSDNVVELTKALVKAQAQFKTPKKTKVGKVSGKNKAGKYYEYEYNYADLQDVYDCIRKPLSENGLAITHLMQEFLGQVELVTMLLHESGEWLRSVYPVKADVERSQAFGSAVTYAKRYSVSALLGIASEDDDDAQAAEGAAKAAGSRSTPSGVTQSPAPQTPSAASEPPLRLFNPENMGVEGTWPRNAGGAKEFMRQLEAACHHSAKYWRIHAQEARGIAENPNLKGRLKVDDEPIAAMVDRLDSMYGGVHVDDEEDGASRLM